MARRSITDTADAAGTAGTALTAEEFSRRHSGTQRTTAGGKFFFIVHVLCELCGYILSLREGFLKKRFTQRREGAKGGALLESYA